MYILANICIELHVYIYYTQIKHIIHSILIPIPIVCFSETALEYTDASSASEAAKLGIDGGAKTMNQLQAERKRHCLFSGSKKQVSTNVELHSFRVGSTCNCTPLMHFRSNHVSTQSNEIAGALPPIVYSRTDNATLGLAGFGTRRMWGTHFKSTRKVHSHQRAVDHCESCCTWCCRFTRKCASSILGDWNGRPLI